MPFKIVYLSIDKFISIEDSDYKEMPQKTKLYKVNWRYLLRHDNKLHQFADINRVVYFYIKEQIEKIPNPL